MRRLGPPFLARNPPFATYTDGSAGQIPRLGWNSCGRTNVSHAKGCYRQQFKGLLGKPSDGTVSSDSNRHPPQPAVSRNIKNIFAADSATWKFPQASPT